MISVFVRRRQSRAKSYSAESICVPSSIVDRGSPERPVLLYLVLNGG